MAKRMISRALLRLILRGAVVCAVLVLVALSAATWSVLLKEREAAQELAAVSAEHAELLARKNALVGDLEALGTPRGVEAAIRERYPLAKPGEELITLVTPSVPTSSADQAHTSFWDTVRHFVGLH